MRELLSAILPAVFLLTCCVDVTLAYELGSRWTRTATNGTNVGTQGSPITLTWGFAPDGTVLPGGPSSNLIAFLDNIYGAGPGGSNLTLRPWFPSYEQAFDRISALSGVTYVYEPNDDGIAFANTTSARGVLGVRGDVRIGGKSYGSGSSTLASNYYPSYGEMMFNTDKGSWYSNTSNNYRRLRNVIMHEAMHGLGIRHVESSSSGFLIEPTLSTSFDGPQLDDLLAIQRHYGDVYEKNGGNDTYNLATALGLVAPAQPRQLGTLGDSTVIAASQTDFLSIDDNSDIDFFSFSIDARLDVRLQAVPRGTTYMVGPQDGTQSSFNSLTQSDLSLALFGTNGASLPSSANANPAGGAENIVQQLMPGTYYARVTGAQNAIQLYGINVSATVPLPANLVWIGSQSNTWNTAITANFENGGVSSVFYAGDNALFDDSSGVNTVNLAADVSPGQMQITTGGNYVFTGSGGIISGTVLVDGTGTVEFANAGNSYSGDTTVTGGTLAITGDANAMQSTIIVNGGATLLMNAIDAADMTSSFSILADGMMQIGILESTGNVFPDNPTSIVNDGTIRVFDEEELRAVSGNGAIHIEREITTLQSNHSFEGSVTVRPGATARVLDDSGLGSSAAVTTVESGGALLVDASPTIAANLNLHGDGEGNGVVRVSAGNNAVFSGTVTLQGESVTIGADAGATALFSAAVDGVTDESGLIMQSDLGANLQLQGGLSLASGSLVKRGEGTGELAGTVDFGGAIVEEGSLRLLGSGTLTGEMRVEQNASLEIGGTHQLSSDVRLIGNGQIRGDVTVPGAIAPGNSAGQLTFVDNLALTTDSLLEIELGGTQAGIDFDLLQVVGAATLDGELQVSLLESFVPQLGNSFEFLTAFAGLSGVFEATTLPPLEDGLAWNVLYGDNAVSLIVEETTITAMPGDFNEDGVVNAADFVAWRNGLQDEHSTAGYEDFYQNFGASSADASFATQAVPEPNPVLLILLATLLSFTALRRSGKQSCGKQPLFAFPSFNQRRFDPRRCRAH